jgi:hypothetical protein
LVLARKRLPTPSAAIYARDQLQSKLPGDLRARFEERVVVEPGEDDQDEPMTETFIEIIDIGSGKRVVTVIEVLSLTNKLPGESRDQYRRKPEELRAGGVSLVEIDLLRAGRRRLGIPYHRIPLSHRTTYQVCVRRGWQPRAVEIYPVPLRQSLPTVSVPLRDTDTDVPLDLQTLLEPCYRNGGYDADIDYRIPPIPPLAADDEAWADALRQRMQTPQTKPPERLG